MTLLTDIVSVTPYKPCRLVTSVAVGGRSVSPILRLRDHARPQKIDGYTHADVLEICHQLH